jgi:hypothetical protein
MSETELAPVALRKSTHELAEKFIKSGLIPQSIRTPEMAVVLIQIGSELGVPPFQSVNQIYLINGRTMLSSQLCRALIFSRYPNCVFRPKIMSAEKCVILAARDRQDEPAEFSYTIEEAKAQNLLSKPGSNWVKAPTDMLIARCSSRVAKVLFPECLAGIDGLHEAGEPVDGEIISADDLENERIYEQTNTDKDWLKKHCLSAGLTDTEAMKKINETGKNKTYKEIKEEVRRQEKATDSIGDGKGGTSGSP